MIRRVLRAMGFNVHVWRYRNPYTRICTICGHQQDYFVRQWANHADPIGWEDMYQREPRVCEQPQTQKNRPPPERGA
jgi:hypothetical protein